MLETLLDKYADEGISNIEDIKVLSVQPLTEFGSLYANHQRIWQQGKIPASSAGIGK